MTMQQQFRKFAVPAVTAAVLVLSGVAHADNTPQQAPDKVDCKKTPDHPKCIK